VSSSNSWRPAGDFLPGIRIREFPDFPAIPNFAKDYLTGNGVPKDPKMAASLFQQLADKGDVEAKAALGYLYCSGIGVEKNTEKGILILREAADGGSRKAAFNLAQILMKNESFL